jgi:hypothetical protein
MCLKLKGDDTGEGVKESYEGGWGEEWNIGCKVQFYEINHSPLNINRHFSLAEKYKENIYWIPDLGKCGNN